MKQILCLILLCISFSAEAQNLKNFYIQSTHSEGLLYFVRPQKMPEKVIDHKMTGKPLSYDYTYLDSRDSVSLLMTVVSKDMFKPDSIQISSDSKVIDQYPLEMIFCKTGKKNHWEYRLSTKIPYLVWTEIYHSPTPMTLRFSSAESKNYIFYGDKASKWKKVSACFAKLQELIRMNRK